MSGKKEREREKKETGERGKVKNRQKDGQREGEGEKGGRKQERKKAVGVISSLVTRFFLFLGRARRNRAASVQRALPAPSAH